MKLFMLLALVSNFAFASQEFYGTFKTENLGELSVNLEFDFESGKTANSVNSYYQEHIDNGQWGDWICENKVTFKDALKISGQVFSDGMKIGTVSNERHDQRKGYLVVSDVQTSKDEFHCELLTLKHSQSALFNGYDSLIKIGKFTLAFSLRSAIVPVKHTEVSPHIYRLDEVNVDSIIENNRYTVQWSVNVDHGSYSNNYEWGYVGLKKGDQ